LEQEEVKDAVWPFRQCGNACQKVAVAQIALLDVLRLWLAHKYLGVLNLFANLAPFNVLKFLNCAPFSTERVIAGREPIVEELLSLLL
jgi:hypothetical protein